MAHVLQVNTNIYLLETSILYACAVPHRCSASLCHCRQEGNHAPNLCDPFEEKSHHQLDVSAMPNGDWLPRLLSVLVE